jgi:hypothetical protein
MSTVARRRHVRVPVDCPVFVYAGAKDRTKCVARDVSLSGMRLEGADHAGLNSRIYLEFALPHHRDFPVMAIGRVVWSTDEKTGEPAATGVEMLRYFPSARFAVRSFLDRHKRRRLNYNLFDEAS